MILSADQCKWLAKDVNSKTDQFVFVGVGKATAKEIEELKGLDELSAEVQGRHLISNYDDLK